MKLYQTTLARLVTPIIRIHSVRWPPLSLSRSIQMGLALLPAPVAVIPNMCGIVGMSLEWRYIPEAGSNYWSSSTR